MKLQDEIQKLVDDQLEKAGIHWQIELLRRANKNYAMRVVKKSGPKLKAAKSFDVLLKLAKKKGLIVATMPTLVELRKKHLTDIGFKGQPIGSQWGNFLVLMPPRKKKKPPIAPKNRNPKRKRSKRRFLKKAQFPPPFKKLTRKRAKKLIERFQLHKNPDPPACEICGMTYKEMKTGLDFATVQDMLFVDSSDPKFWRQKGRSSVLGVWFEIKRSMWRDHLEMCDDTPAQEIYLEDFEY